MDKNPLKKQFISFVMDAVIMALLLLCFVGIPVLNENQIYEKLQVEFAKFRATTKKNFPNDMERKQRLDTILKAKDSIVVASSWSSMSCYAIFWEKDPGSAYRNDTIQVKCWWKWL